MFDPRHGAHLTPSACGDQPSPAHALPQAPWEATPLGSTLHSVPPHHLLGGWGAPRRAYYTSTAHPRHGAVRQWNPRRGRRAVARPLSIPGWDTCPPSGGVFSTFWPTMKIPVGLVWPPKKTINSIRIIHILTKFGECHVSTK